MITGCFIPESNILNLHVILKRRENYAHCSSFQHKVKIVPTHKSTILHRSITAQNMNVLRHQQNTHDNNRTHCMVHGHPTAMAHAPRKLFSNADQYLLLREQQMGMLAKFSRCIVTKWSDKEAENNRVETACGDPLECWPCCHREAEARSASCHCLGGSCDSLDRLCPFKIKSVASAGGKGEGMGMTVAKCQYQWATKGLTGSQCHC